MFEATGFIQTISAQPILSDRQDLGIESRFKKIGISKSIYKNEDVDWYVEYSNSPMILE